MSTQPDPPLDAIDALKRIRKVVEASANLTYGTRAEPTIREIARILDQALPPRRRVPPTSR